MPTRISDAVIRRLPRYYRQLGALQQDGVERISSLALSRMMNITASQIRQDLSCFGGFGQQGYGYNVRELRRHVADILGLNKEYTVVILGAGNIGQALSNYSAFASEGYRILALFDADPALTGKDVRGIPVLPVQDLQGFLEGHSVDIAVLAVPAPAALPLARKLVQAGVRAIWNFAPVEIVIEGVVVENAHLTDGLMALTYRLGELRKL